MIHTLTLKNAPPVVEPREPAPVTISVAIMAGNEAWCIEDAIKSASWADEVVLLDTGSTDGTGALAARLGAKVTREERIVDLGDGLRSIDDFAGARNRVMSLCSGDWIVLLDADERFVGSLRPVLEVMPACVDYAATVLHHEGRPELMQRMPRIFRRASEPRYQHRIHETLQDWATGRCMAVLPEDAGHVVHLGGRHETRTKHRREDRNWRIIQRCLADDPNDVHVLSYAVDTLSEMGRDDLAEPLARHAFALATETHAARSRIAMALAEIHWRRRELDRVVEVLEEAQRRYSVNQTLIGAYGVALWLAGRPEAREVLLRALEKPDELSVVMLNQVRDALEELRHAA